MKKFINNPKISKSKWLPVLIWAFIFSLFYGVGLVIPPGFDWYSFFGKGAVSQIWPPWTTVILKLINWPLTVAITLFAIVFRGYRYNRSPIPIALAVLSLPTMWVLFDGNLDGLVLLGLLLMPWGVPLVIMKPQLAAFSLLAKKKWIIAGVIWGALSLVIWGLWPLRFTTVFSQGWKVEWTQDINLFPWGAIIALPLFWLSRGDEDLLMAAGSFVTPHLFPYHYILLMPALSRMSKFWMVLTWAISWTPLVANWVGAMGWHMGNVLGICLWLGVYLNKKKRLLQTDHKELTADQELFT